MDHSQLDLREKHQDQVELLAQEAGNELKSAWGPATI
jgi:hypothetical protein